MSFKRICPTCKNTVNHQSKQGYTKAIKYNRSCKKCSINKNFENYRNKISSGEIDNPFKGKKHSDKSKSKIRNSRLGKIHTCTAKRKISNATKGSKNAMYGRSFYDVWLEKYGKTEADIRLEEFKRKQSFNNSGSKNAMYGKPSPQGTGNGWSGRYNGKYFRSLHELCFLVNWIDRFNMTYESAEKKKYKIPYIFNNTTRNYFADWLINNKYLVEVKPRKLWNTPQNKAKNQAAKKYCKKHNLIFKLIDPGKIETNKIISLYNSQIIIFTKNYGDRFRKEYI